MKIYFFLIKVRVKRKQDSIGLGKKPIMHH